jgi:hypothetical protein
MGVYRVWVGKPEGKNHSEDPGLYGRIILRWVLGKWDRGACTGSILLRIGTRGCICKCGNKPLGSITCGKFLD